MSYTQPVDQNTVVARSLSLASVTTESALYGLAALVGLGFRLILPGVDPLLPAEAAQALPAHLAATGRAFETTGLSPLLFTLQATLFAPFGSSDAAARWPAAVAGGLAVLLFYLLRRPLGRLGALAAAFLWSAAPLAVFSGRLALGDSLVPPLLLGIVAAFAALVDAERAPQARRAAIGLGVATGLLLASGPAAYSGLLGLAVAALLWRGDAARNAWVRLRDHGRLVAVAGAIALFLGATAWGTTLPGLAAAASLLGDWARGLTQAGEHSLVSLLRTLALSDPLLIALAMPGAWLALRQSGRSPLVAAAAVVVVLCLLPPGRNPAALGVVTLSLVLLAGPALAWLLERAAPAATEADAWVLVALSLALAAATSIAVAAFFNAPNDQYRTLYQGIGAGAAILLAGLWLAYGLWGSRDVTLRALPPFLLALGMIWGGSGLSAVNYDRYWLRRAAVWPETPGLDWSLFREELVRLSSQAGGSYREAGVQLVLPNPEPSPLDLMLRWEMRNFTGLQVVTLTAPGPDHAAPDHHYARAAGR